MAEPHEKEMAEHREKEFSPTIIVLGPGLGKARGLGALGGRWSVRRSRLGELTPHHQRQLEFDISSDYLDKLGYSSGLRRFGPKTVLHYYADPGLVGEAVEEEGDPLSTRTYRRLLEEIADLDIEQVEEALTGGALPEEMLVGEEPAEDSTAEERLEEIQGALQRSRQLGEQAQRGIDALLERRAAPRS